jgi:sterol desaturase/sphingolipid hydroxylase (fatty acid hydroxylase superfamily)
MPYCFYAPLAIGATVAAHRSETIPIIHVTTLIAAGLLSWGLFEYVIHRFVLHRDPAAGRVVLPGNVTHLAHHADPDALDRLYVPLREGVPIAAAYYVMVWALTGSWQAAAHLFAGLMLGYLFYEWLDYEAHHGRSRSSVMRYYRKYHLQHHYVADRARYGVTSPIFDMLFGTYHIARGQSRQRRAGATSHS